MDFGEAFAHAYTHTQRSTVGLISGQGFEWLERFLCLGVYWSEVMKKYMQRRDGYDFCFIAVAEYYKLMIFKLT